MSEPERKPNVGDAFSALDEDQEEVTLTVTAVLEWDDDAGVWDVESDAGYASIYWEDATHQWVAIEE